LRIKSAQRSHRCAKWRQTTLLSGLGLPFAIASHSAANLRKRSDVCKMTSRFSGLPILNHPAQKMFPQNMRKMEKI
jgi:hypothetical protein